MLKEEARRLDGRQIQEQGDWFRARRKPLRQSLADQVKANLNAAGVKEILYEEINPGEKTTAPLSAS